MSAGASSAAPPVGEGGPANLPEGACHEEVPSTLPSYDSDRLVSETKGEAAGEAALPLHAQHTESQQKQPEEEEQQQQEDDEREEVEKREQQQKREEVPSLLSAGEEDHDSNDEKRDGDIPVSFIDDVIDLILSEVRGDGRGIGRGDGGTGDSVAEGSVVPPTGGVKGVGTEPIEETSGANEEARRRGVAEPCPNSLNAEQSYDRGAGWRRAERDAVDMSAWRPGGFSEMDEPEKQATVADCEDVHTEPEGPSDQVMPHETVSGGDAEMCDDDEALEELITAKDELLVPDDENGATNVVTDDIYTDVKVLVGCVDDAGAAANVENQVSSLSQPGGCEKDEVIEPGPKSTATVEADGSEDRSEDNMFMQEEVKDIKLMSYSPPAETSDDSNHRTEALGMDNQKHVNTLQEGRALPDLPCSADHHTSCDGQSSPNVARSDRAPKTLPKPKIPLAELLQRADSQNGSFDEPSGSTVCPVALRVDSGSRTSHSVGRVSFTALPNPEQPPDKNRAVEVTKIAMEVKVDDKAEAATCRPVKPMTPGQILSRRHSKEWVATKPAADSFRSFSTASVGDDKSKQRLAAVGRAQSFQPKSPLVASRSLQSEPTEGKGTIGKCGDGGTGPTVFLKVKATAVMLDDADDDCVGLAERSSLPSYRSVAVNPDGDKKIVAIACTGKTMHRQQTASPVADSDVERGGGDVERSVVPDIQPRKVKWSDAEKDTSKVMDLTETSKPTGLSVRQKIYSFESLFGIQDAPLSGLKPGDRRSLVGYIPVGHSDEDRSTALLRKDLACHGGKRDTLLKLSKSTSLDVHSHKMMCKNQDGTQAKKLFLERTSSADVHTLSDRSQTASIARCSSIGSSPPPAARAQHHPGLSSPSTTHSRWAGHLVKQPNDDALPAGNPSAPSENDDAEISPSSLVLLQSLATCSASRQIVGLRDETVLANPPNIVTTATTVTTCSSSPESASDEDSVSAPDSDNCQLDRSFSISLAELNESVSSALWDEGGRERSPSSSSTLSVASVASLLPSAEIERLVEESRSLGDEGLEDVRVVVLHKDEDIGLGFSVAGGHDQQNAIVTIHRVFSRGMAAQEGTIQPGDRLLSINGRTLKGASHDEALNAVRQARMPRQAVVVVQKSGGGSGCGGGGGAGGGSGGGGLAAGRHADLRGDCASGRNRSVTAASGDANAGDAGDDRKEKNQGRGDGETVTVELLKTGGGLGFSLEGGRGSIHGDRELTVRRVFAAGDASGVRAGDVLLSVGGRDVRDLSRFDAWNHIKALPEGVTVVTLRRAGGDDGARSTS